MYLVSASSFLIACLLAWPALTQPVAKMLPIVCMSPEIYHKKIGFKERVWMAGVMPSLPEHLLEIWRNPKGDGWTITIRSAKEKEICIISAGSQLVPTEWFTESGLQ